MPSKLTRRQLAVSMLAMVEGLGYKEIGARAGMSRAMVAEYLGRKRKKELDDEVYQKLLSAFARRRASAPSLEVFLEGLDFLETEADLTDEELAGIEEELLTASRLIRKLLAAALRSGREAGVEDGYPLALEAFLDRRQAEEQFAKLKRLDARSRLAVVRLNREYQHWALMEGCCEAAVEEGSRDLKRSAAWARLALAIAKWVPGPEGWRRRGRGYALAHWANLLKVRGELQVAEVRLEEAKRLWLGGSDPAGLFDPGRLLDLEGSLRRAQRRFAEAHSLFDQAIPVSRFPERALMMKGTTYDVMGEYEQAIATFLQAEPLVERRGDPRTVYLLRFNLGANYSNIGDYARAADLVEQVRGLASALGDHIFLLRLSWLEGRILAGLGRRGEALLLLAEARERFAAEKMFYDVALVMLEESALLLDEGRMMEVKALTLELASVFESKGVHREALAALQVFEGAVRRETATAELARQILRFLFQARHDQGLRFES
jgi:tetratricopeptide (TPR) repeat protein